MAKFRGTYTVLVTPFTADGTRIDTAALRRLVDYQIEGGVHGLVPLGSTGEFLSMTREERAEVISTVIDQTRRRVPVLIGTGAEWTPDAVALSKEAEAMGADGVMIIPPFYSVPTDEELYVHYKAIADAISLPIMIYNNPATANVDMLPPVVAKLSEIPNVLYIKESTLDVTRVRDIVRLCGDRMTVFAGVLGYESFFLGAEGWVAVCSNVAPRFSAQLFEAAADRNNPAEARAIHEKLVDLLWWVGGPRYVSGTKAALEMIGLSVGPPRAPRLPLPQQMRGDLQAVLQRLDLSLPKAA
ncbi:4-hydroxy-tetrahydrodipicolinate synthase [Terrarubrum flagellatum]|uniref:4-hydroxy-tetrahydrodipicolinate synthase n=1 Tax=Terrirubrum flagellatum TaxID=2895980 RepID=UPI0031451DAD